MLPKFLLPILNAKAEIYIHKNMSKNLIISQSLCIGPLQGERALLGGAEYVEIEIQSNGA